MKKSTLIKAVLFFILLGGLALPALAQRLEEIEDRLKDPPPRRFTLQRTSFENLDYYRPLWPPGLYGFFHPAYYSRSPYRSPDLEAAEIEIFTHGRPFSLNTGFHYFYDTRGDLDGGRGEISLGTPVGKWSADFTRFRERLPGPEPEIGGEAGSTNGLPEEPGTLGRYDYLNLYYIDYRLGLYSPRFSWEIGGGYTGMRREHSWHGGHVLMAVEVWPYNPLCIDAMIRYSLIRSSNASDLRFGINLFYEWGGVRIGWRLTHFESGTNIGGPEFGVKIRF